MNETVNESYVILGMGMIGETLYKKLANNVSDYRIFAFDRARVDVTERKQIRQILEYVQPSTVILSAGLSDVDLCESDKNLARTLNTLAPELVAEECKRIHAKIVFFSTAMVYSNNRRSASSERTKIDPVNYFAKSKIEGETLIKKQVANHLIIRLGSLFSEHEKNMLNRAITLKEKGLKVFASNGLINPTYVDDACNAVIGLIQHGSVGTFNVANRGTTTIANFLTKTFELAKMEGKIEGIPEGAKGLFADRPFNQSLSIKKFEKETNCTLRFWEEALKDCIGKIKGIT